MRVWARKASDELNSGKRATVTFRLRCMRCVSVSPVGARTCPLRRLVEEHKKIPKFISTLSWPQHFAFAILETAEKRRDLRS